MKRYIILLVLCLFNVSLMLAQRTLQEGKCGDQVSWTFDGQQLKIERLNEKKSEVAIPNYDIKKNVAPWIKKHLNIKKINIGVGITRIGSCAFAGLTHLESVEFEDDMYLTSIGWGAFLNCKNLFSFTIPSGIQKIETLAFANCSSLRSIKIPAKTRVDDMAFVSCTNLAVIELAPTVSLGRNVFITENNENGEITHTCYNGEIRNLPANINEVNCTEYGISKESVETASANSDNNEPSVDKATCDLDTQIPSTNDYRPGTYALIIGNETYKFNPKVPFAIHDAKVFSEYCVKSLGIPSENVHVVNNATKQMILGDEIGDWLTNDITDKANKTLVVYYAGHGVPDIKDHNKAYMLPVDVRGSKPTQGIALQDFYAQLSDLGFDKIVVFMDACFSGINRNNLALNGEERGVEIDVDTDEAFESSAGKTNMIVFSAAQGNETAQSYQQEGHGLFTYYLLDGLQKSQIGIKNFGTLSNYIESNVTKTAPTLNARKKQTPKTTVSSGISDIWSGMWF